MTQVAEPQVQRWVGGGLLRKEDPELLTGQGRYVDDLALPGMLWLAFVRSPLAHAVVTRVDTSAAKQRPGVVAAFTGAELASEWAAPMPCAWPIADRKLPDEPTADPRVPDHWPVARDRVRYAGEIVAVVVADSREHAFDAVEAVDVDYDELPVVTDMEEALEEGAPVIHEQFGTNRTYTWSTSNGDVDKVFSEAPVVVRERYHHPRLIPNAIEPRGVLVQPVPAQGEFTVWSATQIPHILRTLFALTLGITESKIRVVAPEVGGGFGSKLNVYAEELAAVAVARRLGRPVKWVETRSEGYLATIHGRDVIQDMEVAATEEGKLLGVRAKVLCDMGAYCHLVSPGIQVLGATLFSGVYQAAAASFECTAVFTNRTPTDAYRGAGRPEATYAIERIMDALAHRVGRDPAEVRRMNFIPPFSEPTPNPFGAMYDSGNYVAGLDKALRLADYEGLRREQAERRQRGDAKQLGIGLSTYIEACGSAPSRGFGAVNFAAGGWEAATIRCLPTGKVVVVTGTSPHGQGHETSWSQIAADALGVKFEDVEVLHGDTAISPQGLDTYGSRSLAAGGVAIQKAAEKVIAKARRIAAHELEVAEEDVEFADGALRVRGAPDRAKTIPEIAFSAFLAHNLPDGVEPGLEETALFDPVNNTFPSGAHVCVVEVDTDTGLVEILKYVAVDDCGVIVNPIIAEGMVHGGVAQGIAEGLYEEATYDEEGNLTSGNMGAYRVPSAAELPSFVTDHVVTPSTSNPGGWKGVGEAGTIGSPPAVVNAVVDALAPLGVTNIGMPVSPERVWRAIQEARAGAGGAATDQGGQA
ncbi:MAG TPA: xanthine dehydrogenase family protein molybdopterin-binding subunit [Actinomycetes bacterium]|nr:xanthine dehydrogenase family protein molybdopterin-binding subunit [Actinomycetes bacterium]